MSGPNSDYDPVEVTPLKAEEVEAMREAALAAIAGATDLEGLKRVRLEHAGDRSPLALANREIGALPPQARKDAGQRVGQARGAVNQALAERQTVLQAENEERMLVEETVDVTLPTERFARGARHPLTTGAERIADVFVAMGWEIAEGPVIEAEWLNFDALNLGPDHPARTMQDTFWTDPSENGLVLRTHTSPVQARTMLTREPPSTSSVPAGCSAPTSTTPPTARCSTRSRARHRRGHHDGPPQGTLDHFAAAMFGEGISTRFRPSYFPFTEPSAEVDLVCFGVAAGRRRRRADCRTCAARGWIEWGGCGIVNPRVLTAVRRRLRALHRLRVRHGHRPHADVPPRHRGPPRVLRGRRPLHHCLRDGDLMKAPVSWIREYVDLPADVTTEDLAARLTALGLKLEAIERPGEDITGPLVVGRVLTAGGRAAEERQDHQLVHGRRRPTLNAGTGPSRRRASSAVRTTSHPATWSSSRCPAPCCPATSQISARKTYGHLSSGMICSAQELGLGDDHEGIIVLPADAGEPGDDAFEALHLRDEVIEFEINPDRAYALSLRGIAREAALAYRAPYRDPARRTVPAANEAGYPVVVDDAAGLPGVRGPQGHRLRPGRAHPDWMVRASPRPACARSRWPSTSPTT